ncbi:hypothetical protein N4G69_24500, partial [Streptomyces mirabilis]|nr:hypothetical protein [Streptomyces mirabilis]
MESITVCAALPAISATAADHDAYVAVDASGTFSQATREAGLLRMQQAGGHAVRRPGQPDLRGLPGL